MIKVLKTKNKKSDQDPNILKEKEASKVLFTMHHQSEEERASALAGQLNLPYIDTNLIPISNDSLKALPEEDARKFNLAVIQKAGKKVTFVSSQPENSATLDFIRKIQQEKGWEGKLFVVSSYNLAKLWERYKKIVFTDVLTQLNLNLTEKDLQNFDQELKDLISLKERISELPTTQILSVIMGGGYKLGASDIHIEPQENDIRLRYRIDGVLHDVEFLPKTIFKSIISRIKMMSGMKINLRDIAQDGTFEINVTDKKIDVRVSIIPGNFGESIVMRLLDPSSIQVKIDSLGLRGLAYEELQKQLNNPNGMILT
ncbi:Flp pilus assembly complex ATPase component TadA, partial [Patescibacteria group bacterium]|nr:Flp pilus assembly complex ATPase component TadA [Patescibacteria group bacterium]